MILCLVYAQVKNTIILRYTVMSFLQAPVSTERLNASQLPLSWPQIDFHASVMATDTSQVLQHSFLVPGNPYGKMLNAQHLDMDHWPSMTANLNQEVFAFPALHSPSWTAPSSPSEVPNSRNRTMQLYITVLILLTLSPKILQRFFRVLVRPFGVQFYLLQSLACIRLQCTCSNPT